MDIEEIYRRLINFQVMRYESGWPIEAFKAFYEEVKKMDLPGVSIEKRKQRLIENKFLYGYAVVIRDVVTGEKRYDCCVQFRTYLAFGKEKLLREVHMFMGEHMKNVRFDDGSLVDVDIEELPLLPFK